MRLVKAALLVAMGFSLLWMWSARDYVVAAYQTSADAPQVRLSGVDLAVAKSAASPSPFAIPVAPDTRSRPVPALAMIDATNAGPVVQMDGGKAALRGTVTGPDGLPVDGATVEVQRHTSGGDASKILETDALGQWTAAGLPGGRYRIRAWVAGVLTMGGSEVVFLAEDENADLPFSLWGIDPAPQLELVHSGELFVAIPGTLAVVVTSKIIDEHGVVLTVPVVGAPVTIQTTQHVSVLSAPLQYTGNDGAARFAVVCPQSMVDTGIGTPDSAISGTAISGTANPGTAIPGIAGEAPSPSVGIGTLVARSGELVGGFALPTCVPAPAPEPVEEPAAQTTGTQGPSNG